jgi:hypothetical protein
MKQSNRKPEMIIERSRVRVNEAFLNALKRLYPKFILVGTPTRGMTLIHPESENDLQFYTDDRSGDNRYDFYFTPSRTYEGWYDVGYTRGYLKLLEADANRMRATVKKASSLRDHLVKMGSSNPKLRPHISRILSALDP